MKLAYNITYVVDAQHVDRWRMWMKMNILDTLWRRINGKGKTKSCFPESFTDIHSHILPSMDDGASDLNTARNLLQEMGRIGITSFVFTPHVMKGVWDNTSERILDRLDKFRNQLTTEEQKAYQFRAAAEYMLDDGFADLLTKGDILPVIDNYILVEMSYLAPPVNVHELVAEIQVAGYHPIMAHPERYFYLHDHIREYERLKEAGCYFQLNLLSLSSWYGKDVKKMAGDLMEQGWYDFVGTDVHHRRHMAKLNDLTKRKGFWQKINPLLDIHQQRMGKGD